MRNTDISGKPLPRKVSCSHGPVPWLLPLLVVLVLAFVYPTIEVIRYSFTDANLAKKAYTYTLKSYRTIFSNPSTYVILGNTFSFVFFSVVFQTLLGFLIALAVDKGEQMHLHGTVLVRG